MINSILLTVAGTNRELLDRAPQDKTKQAALGGAILTTASLAAVSAGVALVMALDLPWWLAVPAAACWGIAILNLDRWLVVATPRQRRWWTTIGMALPRLALALLIGLVVSTPLTLLVFDNEIDAELVAMHARDLAKFEDELGADARFADLPADKERLAALKADLADGSDDNDVFEHPEVKALRDQLTQVSSAYDEAEQLVTCEKEGTCGSGQRGVGPAAADKERRRDRLAGERSALQAALAVKTAEVTRAMEQQSAAQAVNLESEIAALEEEVRSVEAARLAQVEEHQAAVAANDGLLARLDALHELESSRPNLRTAHLVLFAFLTALECLPIIFKTLLSLGRSSHYEWLQSKEDQRGEDLALLQYEYEFEEAVLMGNAALDAARARAAAQLEAENRTAKVVLDAQVDLAQSAVGRWKEEQVGHLADNMSQWVKHFNAVLSNDDPAPQPFDVGRPASDGIPQQRSSVVHDGSTSFVPWSHNGTGGPVARNNGA